MLLVNNTFWINITGGERIFECNPDRTCPMLVLFYLVSGTCIGIQRFRAVAPQPPELPPATIHIANKAVGNHSAHASFRSLENRAGEPVSPEVSIFDKDYVGVDTGWTPDANQRLVLDEKWDIHSHQWLLCGMTGISITCRPREYGRCRIWGRLRSFSIL